MSMLREHTRCLFDLCNFGGSNCGAWADLYGDDLVVFGGMWHGDITDHLNPKEGDCYDLQLWLPGAGPKEREICRLSNGEIYADFSLNGSVYFGAKGDVSTLVSQFDKISETGYISLEPKHFRGCSIASWEECQDLRTTKGES